MMTHEVAQELLAVYALNAVDGEERADLQLHVDECVRCSSELDALRSVSTAMGDHGEPASQELWERISSHLYDGTGTVPAIRTLGLPGATVVPLGGRRAFRLRAKYAVSAFAVAAAALVGILGINLASADNHITQLNSALTIATGATNQALINAALATPGHLDVNLTGSHSSSLARFVLLNGQGYLVSSNFATLPSTETYQLWGIINGKPISIGVMGNEPVTVSFTFVGSKSPSEIAVTIEPTGGSVAPTSPIVAAGKATV